MKLLQTSLLILLAFAAGIVCYRAAVRTPEEMLAPSNVDLGNARAMDARIILADSPQAAQTLSASTAIPAAAEFLARNPSATPNTAKTAAEPVTFDAAPAAVDDIVIRDVHSFDVQVAQSTSETSDIASDFSPAEPDPEPLAAEPQPQVFGVEVEPEPGILDAAPVEAAETEFELEIYAVPDGSRVRFAGPDLTLETDALRLESATSSEVAGPRSGDSFEIDTDELSPDDAIERAVEFLEVRRSQSADEDATPAKPVSNNPIPEFLRGRDLPPLVAGQKVVTISVPVENWVELGWGDQVRVEFEKALPPTPASDGPVPRNPRLQVCEGEIYALPQIAPEKEDTVPVCLKLTIRAAKEMLAIRKNPGTYTLSVTKKREPVSATYEDAPNYRAPVESMPSREPVPIAPHDDFTPQPRQPELVPEPATPYSPPDDELVPPGDPLPTPEPSDLPEPRDDYDPQPQRVLPTPPQADDIPAPIARHDEFVPPQQSPDPVPDATYEEAPLYDPPERSVPQPLREPDGPEIARGVAPAEALPQIEPSSVGTVHRLDGAGAYTIASGDALLFETPLPVQRVSGFDAGVIRVTAESSRRLKVEGVTGGETAMIVQLAQNVFPAFDVQITVPQMNPAYPSGDDEHYAEEALRQKVVARERTQAEVEQLLHELYPDAELKIVWIRDSMLLRGTVASEAEAQEVSDIAEQYVPHILNQLKARSESELQPQTFQPPAERPTPARESRQPRRSESAATREIPIVVTNPPEQLRTLNPGDRVNVLKVTYPPLPAGLGAVTEKLVVHMAKLVRVDLGDDRVATLELTAEQASAVLQSGEKPLTIQVPVSARPEPTGTAGTPVPVEVQRSALRSDIRALHDDVRKLIALLEHRLSDHSHEHGSTHDAPFYESDAVDSSPTTNAVPSYSQSRTDEYSPSRTDKPVEATEPAGEPVPDDAPAETESTTESSPDEATNSVDREAAAFLDRVWHFVGVRFTPVGEDFPLLRGRFVPGGLRVDEVRANSPLEKANVQAGDVIIGVRDWETVDAGALKYALDQTSALGVWDVQFHVLRANERASVQAQVQWKRLKPPPTGRPIPDQTADEHLTDATFRDALWKQVGLRVSPIAADADVFADQPYKGGLRIDEVRPDSPMSDSGARQGDILVGLQQWEILNEDAVRFVLNHRTTQENEGLKFYLLRNRETVYGHVHIDWPKPSTNGISISLPAGLTPQNQLDNTAPLDEFVAVQAAKMTPVFSFYVGFTR